MLSPVAFRNSLWVTGGGLELLRNGKTRGLNVSEGRPGTNRVCWYHFMRHDHRLDPPVSITHHPKPTNHRP